MREHKPVVYIAGCYSDGNNLDATTRELNRLRMQEYSLRFMALGCATINPIENDMWAYDNGSLSYDDALSNDFAVIKKCDFIFMCPGWEEGSGSTKEYEFAVKNNIPVLFDAVLQMGNVSELVHRFLNEECEPCK